MNETYIREFILDGNFLNTTSIKKIEEKMFQENLSFLDSIVEMDLLEQETLNKIISLLDGIPKIKLEKQAINIDTFLIIPEPIARTKKIIAFKNTDNSVSIAIPDTKIDYDFLRQIIPDEYSIEIFLADEKEINKKIADYQKLLKSGLVSGMINNLGKITKVENFGFSSEKDLPDNYMSDIANDYYAEKFIRELLEYAKTSNASHIYINNGEKENLISFRIHGYNYGVMTIEKDTIFSISTRLKQLADVNIFTQEEIIKGTSFKGELNGEISNIFLSFVKTVFGEAITLELVEDKEFGTDFITFVSEQKEILHKHLNDDKGFYIIAGEKQSGKTKTTYALLENEVEKNKEIYSLEDTILNRIDFVNQILIDKKTNKNILLTKVIQNKPDLISVDFIKSYILKTLFNYVAFGGKVILGIKEDSSTLLDTILEPDFNKGMVVRNFNLYIEHKKFKSLNIKNAKKVSLSKSDLENLKSFISSKEILELFKREKLIKESVSKINSIDFYIQKKKEKNDDFVYIRGILDLGLTLENSFLKKYSNEKIKLNLKQNIKKTIIENALILSFQGKIDLADLIKYLVK